MCPFVTLRHVGTGEPVTVNTDSVDVSAAVASGKFQKVAAPGETVELPGGPGQRRITRDVGPALTNKQTTADIGKHVVREVGPSLAAAAATTLVPEIAAGAGLAKFLPLLARMGAAGAGGTAGTLGAQGLTGSPLDLGKAVSRGVGEMTAQGLGEGAAGMAQGAAESIYRGVLRPGTKLAEQAAKTQSRLAGETVAPDVADLARQAIHERVPIGRGLSGTGTEKMAGIVAPQEAAKNAAIAKANKAKWSFNPQRLASGITELKAELASEVGGTKKAALVDEMWQDELAKRHITTYPSGRPRPGAPKINRMSAAELDEAVSKWQKQADYGKDSADPKEALQSRVAKSLARWGRTELRSIQTPAGNGQTVGEILGAANDRMSSLHPLQDAVSNAENRLASGSGSTNLPWYMHAGGPVAGATLGTAVGGVHGAGAGAALGFAADRALSSPLTGSRLALFMTNPIVKQAVTQSPRLGLALSQLLSTPATPDATQGGSR